MAFQLVVNRTFFDLDESDGDQTEFDFDSAHGRHRANTDTCVDYITQTVTEKTDHQFEKRLSNTSTVTGSSTAHSGSSSTRSSAGSDAGDLSDHKSDDVQLRPAGVWLPPGTHAFWPEATWHAATAPAWGMGCSTAADAQGELWPGKRGPYPEARVSHDDSTTMVVRGLSKDMPRAKLCEMIDSVGLERSYDFVYMPKDFKKGKGLGYAMINFVDHETAERARDACAEFASSVDWCDSNQGLDELIQRYRDSPVLHAGRPEDAKPILFVNGTAVPFPPPTYAVGRH